jgi:hypothetical protein
MSDTNTQYDNTLTFGLFPMEEDETLYVGHFEKNFNRGAMARVLDNEITVALDEQVVGSLEFVGTTEKGSAHFKGRVLNRAYHGFINQTDKGKVLNLKPSTVKSFEEVKAKMPEGF